MEQPSKNDHGRRRQVAARHRKVARVLSLLRKAVPAEDFDESDWEALHVAVRIVYETEDLGRLLGWKWTRDRELAISDWSDSMEGAITFMSWIRELTSILTGATYSPGPPVSVAGLWRRHRVQALRLVDSKLAPAQRMSVLVELGGIEVTLWGQTWALEPMRLRTAGQV